MAARKARLWPYFAAISTRPLAWLVLYSGAPSLPWSSLTCPGRRSELGRMRCARRFGKATHIGLAGGERRMFEFRDLFQWDRFITPTIIKTFYWLGLALIILARPSGIFSRLAAMGVSPFGGFLMLLSSLVGAGLGIVFSRIIAEFILIVFRIN